MLTAAENAVTSEGWGGGVCVPGFEAQPLIETAEHLQNNQRTVSVSVCGLC